MRSVRSVSYFTQMSMNPWSNDFLLRKREVQWATEVKLYAHVDFLQLGNTFGERQEREQSDGDFSHG